MEVCVNGAVAENDVETTIPMEPTVKKNHGSVISFYNISYAIDIKQTCCSSCRPTTKKTILNGVSGILAPGLNALMGSTGSGKSTLLDVLTNRKNPNCVSGSVFLNGRTLPTNFQYHTGYVVQSDRLVPTISVLETLWFCANLRLPRSATHAEKKQRIEQIIKDLGLQSCVDTHIGNDIIRGVSGGERKRTSIACELILEPQIIFLDEPTTGLDATTAWSVISLLKRLGNQGHTIVCSIHQPRYSIYKMFDTLTLLSKGELVYHGESQEALPFFGGLGYASETHDNPADFFLDVLNGSHEKVEDPTYGKRTSNETNVELTKNMKERYRKSQKYTALEKELEKLEENTGGAKPSHGRMYATGFLQQMNVLLNRAGKDMIRNPQAMVTNAIVNLFIGIVMGLIFFQVDNTPDKGVQNRLGILFFINANLMMGRILVIEHFTKAREIFIHEHVSGYYSVFSYFVSKVLADLIPLRTISPIMFCSITYWMVGLKLDAGAFFVFLLTALLVGYASVGVGLFFCTTFCPSVERLCTILYFLISATFSGLVVNVDAIMPLLSWLKYLSIARYGIVAMAINEMSGSIFTSCSNVTEMYSARPPASAFGGATSDFSVTHFNGTACVFVNGEEFLYQTLATSKNLTDWDFWLNHVALACIIIGMYTLTYIQLSRTNTYY